jgi:septum formation topological specificity factor MinE
MKITKSLCRVEIEHIVARYFDVDLDSVKIVGDGADDIRCEVTNSDDIRNYDKAKEAK